MATDNYSQLVPSDNVPKPLFAEVRSLLVQPAVDQRGVLEKFVRQDFALAAAAGVQLDVLGQWVGISRIVPGVVLQNVYFSFDTAALGLDTAPWFGPDDITTSTSALDDAAYRTLIYVKIAANNWDGTLGEYRRILAQALRNQGVTIAVIDNFDMTMTVLITGGTLSPVFRAILVNGFLPLKPEGVRIAFQTSSSAAAPAFGFDLNNASIAGLDTGAWIAPL